MPHAKRLFRYHHNGYLFHEPLALLTRVPICCVVFRNIFGVRFGSPTSIYNGHMRSSEKVRLTPLQTTPTHSLLPLTAATSRRRGSARAPGLPWPSSSVTFPGKGRRRRRRGGLLRLLAELAFGREGRRRAPTEADMFCSSASWLLPSNSYVCKP